MSENDCISWDCSCDRCRRERVAVDGNWKLIDVIAKLTEALTFTYARLITAVEDEYGEDSFGIGDYKESVSENNLKRAREYLIEDGVFIARRDHA